MTDPMLIDALRGYLPSARPHAGKDEIAAHEPHVGHGSETALQ